MQNSLSVEEASIYLRYQISLISIVSGRAAAWALNCLLKELNDVEHHVGAQLTFRSRSNALPIAVNYERGTCTHHAADRHNAEADF